MEFDILVVILRHLEDVAAICHEDITTLFVLRHILGLPEYCYPRYSQ